MVPRKGFEPSHLAAYASETYVFTIPPPGHTIFLYGYCPCTPLRYTPGVWLSNSRYHSFRTAHLPFHQLRKKNENNPHISIIFSIEPTLIHLHVLEVLDHSILEILVNGIFHSENSHKRSIPSAWRDAITDKFFYVDFIKTEYIEKCHPDKRFSDDRGHCRRDNRHISIKGEIYKFPVLNHQKNFHDISAHSIGFPMANRSVFEDSLIRWLFRIFDEKGIGIHGEIDYMKQIEKHKKTSYFHKKFRFLLGREMGLHALRRMPTLLAFEMPFKAFLIYRSDSSPKNVKNKKLPIFIRSLVYYWCPRWDLFLLVVPFHFTPCRRQLEPESQIQLAFFFLHFISKKFSVQVTLIQIIKINLPFFRTRA